MTETPAPIAARPANVWAVAALVLRLALGGVFLFAAYSKLNDPDGFVESMQKFNESLALFRAYEHDHLVIVAAFAIPWVEMICGAFLVAGFWTRPAALLLTLALAGFIAAIYVVLQKGQSFDCSCFGRFRLFCPTRLSWCNIYQNAALGLVALALLAGGAGRFGLDALRRPVAPAPPHA